MCLDGHRKVVMPEPRAGPELPGTGVGNRAELNSENGAELSSAVLMETHHCRIKTSLLPTRGRPAAASLLVEGLEVRGRGVCCQLGSGWPTGFGMDSTVF